MASEQKGFVVYGDIEESLNELTDEQVAKLFRGMVSYFNTGKEPKFSGLMKMVFIPIRQQMDRDTDKYEKKCAKNRESIQKYWDKVKADSKEYERIRTNTDEYERIPPNTNVANTNTNTNKDTNTDTGTDTDTESVPDAGLLSFDLIQYLNEKTGSDYKADKANADRVRSLLGQGYTPVQLRSVIDKKCAEWMTDPKMRPYLRPSTLWGAKFPEYVSAPISIGQERERDEAKKRETLEAELTEKKETLSTLRASLDEIKPGTRLDERRALKEQIALLEDSIKIIEGRLK